MEESFFLGFAERRSTLRLGSLDRWNRSIGWWILLVSRVKLVMSEIQIFA